MIDDSYPPMTDDPPDDRHPDRPAAEVAGVDDFHEQDWLIICEALARWAGNPADVERLADPRTARAFDLINTIADDVDLPEGDLMAQVDEDWPTTASAEAETGSDGGDGTDTDADGDGL